MSINILTCACLCYKYCRIPQTLISDSINYCKLLKPKEVKCMQSDVCANNVILRDRITMGVKKFRSLYFKQRSH
jgi:hypothetical protein